MKIIDPWGQDLPEDYISLIQDFGLETFDPSLFPDPNRLMRRNIVFAGRDLKIIADCIKNKKPYYALSGIMPSSERIHFGSKMVVENLKYFQEHGATHTFILVADLESASTRGVTLEEARERAKQFYIPAYIALGLDPKKTTFYFQSENKKVIQLAYEFSKKITLNEFRSVYGSADPGRIMAAVTQVGDMLFPQLEKSMPGIIPVGPDQDPHIRLARDIISRTKSSHSFMPLAGLYHKYTRSLDGGLKMSKSNPESMIELPEDIATVKRKIMRALTGGRDTLEQHRKLGAVVEKCMVFDLLKQHLVEDDKELQKIYEEYKSGKMTSGEIKSLACEKMEHFMDTFTKNLEKARKHIDKLHFITFH
ncbi:tryptophan--tRNA ligase [Candidatus Woesearchaeota archaeon]|nr:tryptophan--tRNA ligase [Candidatus Woesearchaeota archaeon]